VAKIGVIGCGYWGKNLVRNFHELGALYAMCDTSWDRLNTMSKIYPGVHDYGSVDFLLASEVEAVAIATPAETHFRIAKEVLLAGKDVFVEKPFTLRSTDAEELVSLAEQEERVLMVGHVFLYNPAFIELKRMINAGMLGDLNYIYSSRLDFGKIREEENVLWSFAPHDISMILDLVDEEPVSVETHAGSYLNANIADIAMATMRFPNGVKAHVFVSWLHPYKEQKLVVMGSKAFAVFDDMADNKLLLYQHEIKHTDGGFTVQKSEPTAIFVEDKEPLKKECRHFIECLESRQKPRTDGREALKVIKVLEQCGNGRPREYFIHPSSFVDAGAVIGKGTKIWHFSHILANTRIGQNCTIGQNVAVGPDVIVGDNVKIQNNVSVYEGVTLEDDVFCGPSCVFTNIVNPRSRISRRHEFQKTLVKKGATIGANATLMCGVTIGEYALIGAGAVVTKDIPPYALAYGVPARVEGTVDTKGERVE